MELSLIDRISDRVFDLFFHTIIPRIAALDDGVVSDGMSLLLAECKAGMPGPVWDAIGKLEWQQDAERVVQLVKTALEKSPDVRRYQLTLSDVEAGQQPGEVWLFAEEDQMFVAASEYARAVENEIAGQAEEFQEWAHWCLLVGYLGLIMVESLRPLPIASNVPDSGSFCCVGIDDRIHFYLGIRSGGAFSIMGEWN